MKIVLKKKGKKIKENGLKQTLKTPSLGLRPERTPVMYLTLARALRKTAFEIHKAFCRAETCHHFKLAYCQLRLNFWCNCDNIF